MLNRLVIAIVSLLLCAGASAAQTEVTEKAAWTIWKMMQDGPDNHSEIISACREFQRANATDPLADVINGIAAWHLLKAGDIESATTVFGSMLTETYTPTRRAADRMARTWLTRIDMESVKRALAQSYRKEVEYPESLDALARLPLERRPPMTDRWGKPWDYSLRDFKLLKGFANQNYNLQSRTLGKVSDLAAALEIPYAREIRLQPLRMTGQGGNSELILFSTTDPQKKEVMLSEMVAFGKIVLAYSGERILVLSDGNHWKFTARPAR